METMKTDWKRDYLYRMFSHHTRGKEKENYIVNAVWEKLDDLSIQPVTQQYVHRPDGYALIDLYFPQINYAIEVDEVYHKNNTDADKEREIDLFRALSAIDGEALKIQRIDATLSMEDLHACIHDIVAEIKSMVAAAGDTLPSWCEPKVEASEKWERIHAKGALEVNDAYIFPTISDICQKCFAKGDGYSIQRAFFKVSDTQALWCPKLAIELPDGKLKAQSHGWVNILSNDWETITEYNSDDAGKAGKGLHEDLVRLTFAKSKDSRGQDGYRFIGVFQFEKTYYNKCIYKRVAKSLKLF